MKRKKKGNRVPGQLHCLALRERGKTQEGVGGKEKTQSAGVIAFEVTRGKVGEPKNFGHPSGVDSYLTAATRGGKQPGRRMEGQQPSGSV